MAQTLRDVRQEAPKAGLTGYRAIFVISFVLILLVAVCASMVGLNWRAWFPGAERGKSLMQGVTAGVYSFMPNLE